MVQLSVDEAGDGPDASGVGLSMVAIELRQRLVAPQSPDGVLDGDPLRGERGVVGDVLRRPGLLARLAAGVKPRPAGWSGAIPT